MTRSADDFDTPTEATSPGDLDACYGSKYLSATEVGDRKIRTRIARIRKEALQQQGGGTRTKFILSFSTLDKELVLNSTNINALVDVLVGSLPTGLARRSDSSRRRPTWRASQRGRCDCGCSTSRAVPHRCRSRLPSRIRPGPRTRTIPVESSSTRPSKQF